MLQKMHMVKSKHATHSPLAKRCKHSNNLCSSGVMNQINESSSFLHLKIYDLIFFQVWGVFFTIRGK